MVDGAQHGWQVIHHVAVPEADDPVPARFEIFRSGLIIFYLGGVMTAIDFNDQFAFDAAKVGDEFTDSVLPTKIPAIELIPAQCPP